MIASHSEGTNESARLARLISLLVKRKYKQKAANMRLSTTYHRKMSVPGFFQDKEHIQKESVFAKLEKWIVQTFYSFSFSQRLYATSLGIVIFVASLMFAACFLLVGYDNYMLGIR